MRYARNWTAVFCMLLFTAACNEGPTAPSVTPDLSPGAVYDGMSVQGCTSEGHCVLPPISSDPSEPPDCDMWYKPDCGACATSTVIGPDDVQTPSSCPGGGGTGPAPGGDPYTGGGAPGTTPPPPGVNAYQEGPLAWGACILAILGTGYTIDQVASAFEGWWHAQQAYESAKRMYDAIVANPESTSPEAIQLWEFQMEYYKNRRDDAFGVVKERTGATGWALVGAAAACGVAAFLPTP
jgi:hypothetical protein